MTDEDWQGLLLLDKPSGPTSHDLVAAVRRLTGQKRIGHAGTLDPLASGLLPLVLGHATRLVRFLPASPKAYEGSLHLGWTADTDDVTGEVRDRHRGTFPSPAAVAEAARTLEGVQLQRPPAFSARRVSGQRMYRMARRGLDPQAPPHEVEVARFRTEPTGPADTYAFVAEVSSGTYVRALVRDLGARLGCGAVLATLRRTRIGPLSVADAITMTDDSHLTRLRLRAALVPPQGMPLLPPPHRLGDAEPARHFVAGRSIPASGVEDGLLRILDPSGRLLGVAECRQGRLHPRVVVAS